MWEGRFPLPSPTQDADLLHQLAFVPGLKEILLVRQAHALEHATVWILGGTPKSTAYRTITQDDDRYGGLSTAEGFYLFGEVDTDVLHHAVHKALHRLVTGEWHLAVHPRCGTSFAVNMTLSAGMAMGSHFMLPKDPFSQFLGLGAAITLASHLSPTIGEWMQSTVTTAIPFNLKIESVAPRGQMQGKMAHFVRVGWRELD
ncbi:hypothetical protein IQ266_11755 [filamentous cyanobacterium LEGE 11480]|uniref:Uncharacterized protein n=2 Tax=Romeriopsis TaxID=2992131 RepID=A0A928Z3V8_9CYAN|nr:hypothetical protein [Romeriopsis navalis LEGE 11480]